MLVNQKKGVYMDIAAVRNDFPLLTRIIHGKPIIYLDSTATSLKPNQVLLKMDEYYRRYSANIFRGIYDISEEATREYEDVREKTATFINANSSEEIIFTRNTSESLNLILYSLVFPQFLKTDEIMTTIMEHHSNFVPWQQWAAKAGGSMRVWEVLPDGTLDLTKLETLITRKTKLLAITSISNVLGTINPIEEITKRVKKINKNCLVLVDAAQAAPHMAIDVKKWGVDMIAFSSHKMLGPTGVGVLWVKKDVLSGFRPFMYGGEMIREVRVDKTLFKEPPHMFEAGTPDIGGVIGFGAAIDYLTTIGMDEIRNHEVDITTYALRQLQRFDDIKITGPDDPRKRGGVIAFTMGCAHAHDIAQILNEDNVCIRSGNHCAMPLHISLETPATARASFYIYTTKQDIDVFIEGLHKVEKMFK